MSGDKKGHWLEFIEPEWLREGFMQLALAVAVRDCLEAMEDPDLTPTPDEKDLAAQVRRRVSEPLEREAWLPAAPGKTGLVAAMLAKVRTRPAPFHRAAQAVATHLLAGKRTDDLAGELPAALDRAWKTGWAPIDLPGEIDYPERPEALPFPPAQAWLNTAMALQAWRELEPRLWPADLKWRDECQQLLARIRARNDDGSWLSVLAHAYSPADYALFADTAELIDRAMRRVNPLHPEREQRWLGVPLASDWKPAQLAGFPAGKLAEAQKASGSSPGKEGEAWAWLRQSLRATTEEATPPVPPPPVPPRPAPTRGNERLETLRAAVAKSAQLREALEPGLARLAGTLKQAHEPQFADPKIEAEVKPLTTAMEALSRNPTARPALSEFLKQLNAVLKEPPWSIQLTPPDLTLIGRPLSAEFNGLSVRPQPDTTAPWGQIVGLRFHPTRDGKPLGKHQPAALVAVGLSAEVVKEVGELIELTRTDASLDELRRGLRTEMLVSREEFADQFREFYRAYFRRYEQEKPPESDPTAEAFHDVCKAMGLKRFESPRSWDEARGDDYRKEAASPSGTPTTLGWQVHPGWKDEAGAIFLQARGVYK